MKSERSTSTLLYFVRHGSTEWNETGRYQGHADPPLSDRGRREALSAAMKLTHVSLVAVHTSPLRRAEETARCIVAARSEPSPTLYLATQLQEIGLGVWEGLTYAEVEQGWGSLVHRWYDDPTSVTPPGGESFVDFKARVLDYVLKLAELYRGASLAVVTHGGVIRLVQAAVRGMSFRDTWEDSMAPGMIRIIEMDDSVLSRMKDDLVRLR